MLQCSTPSEELYKPILRGNSNNGLKFRNPMTTKSSNGLPAKFDFKTSSVRVTRLQRIQRNSQTAKTNLPLQPNTAKVVIRKSFDSRGSVNETPEP